jgi:acyl dehydratase
MRNYYLDDLNPGDVFTSPSFVLTEKDVIEFAEKYDPQPFHLDRDAAKASHFGGLVAGGFQTAALAWGLAQRTGVYRKCAPSRHRHRQAPLAQTGVGWRRTYMPVRVIEEEDFIVATRSGNRGMSFRCP